MANYSSHRQSAQLRLLQQFWHSRLMAAVLTSGITLLVGFSIVQVFPRGPATATQALIMMSCGFLMGCIGGLVMRSPLAMILAPAAYILAVEVGQLNRVGPTIGPIRLDESFGILAFLLGRGFHGLIGVLPIVAGVGIGMMIADLSDPQLPNVAKPKRRLLSILLTAALIVLAGLIALPASTPPILDDSGHVVSGSIASLEAVQTGGHKQWIMLRGKNKDNPVLLYLSGGPGQSDLSYSRVLFEDLTNDFVVVSWDERGTGKSYASLDPTETLTLNQAIANTAELTQYLKERFGEQKIYLMGESWGSLLGVLTVQKHPELYYAFIGSGQMVDVQESDRQIYQALLQRAQQSEDQQLLAKLQQYGEPPYRDIPYANGFIMSQYPRLEKPYTPPQSYIQRGTPARLGPFNILGREYNLVEKVNILRGLIDMFTVMYPQLQTIDFRQSIQRLEVPIYILDGAAELPARRDLLLEWFDRLVAPKKALFTFENAAHSVAFEQFEALAEILKGTVLPETYPQL
ncbi:MAG: alpha/beta hydrolase [Cyanobacteria bacterium J06621_11]